MNTSPARSFLTLAGHTFETTGLAISSVTLVYFIRLASTIGCNVIEQLPLMITKDDYQLNLFSQDFMNLRHVGYMGFFMGLGVGVRVIGSRIRRDSLISRIEKFFGYANVEQHQE